MRFSIHLGILYIRKNNKCITVQFQIMNDKALDMDKGTKAECKYLDCKRKCVGCVTD